MKRSLYVLVLFLLVSSLILPASQAFAQSPNLIINPSVETATSGQPLNWAKNAWGSNSPVFDYSSTGHSGLYGLSVSMSNYISGDTKWIADPVAVTAGQTYTYSDYSTSTAPTELDAAYTNGSGNPTYAYLKTVPASTAWQLNITTFVVPPGVVSLSIYHILYSNGSLQTDDFSLTTPDITLPAPTPPVTSTNLLANASFESVNNGEPTSWNRGSWGTNTASLSLVSGGAHTGNYSANVSISNITSGDAKWFGTPVSITAGTSYAYEDYYQSTVMTRVVVVMTGSLGTTYTSLLSAPTSNVWTLYSGSFSVPIGVQTVTIYHLLDQAGSLSLDDVSLTPVATPAPVPTPLPAPTNNAIVNPSFEVANGSNPASWEADTWGTHTTSFAYLHDEGHSGTSSAKVTISNYASGDAKWGFTPLNNLTTGSAYSMSAWYKTNTQPRAVASYIDARGTNRYLELSRPLTSVDAATTWHQYATKIYLPSNATSISVFLLIASNGWLQTDDFSLTPYTPVGFGAPIISLTFDDGWSSIYTNGLPLLKKYGFVSTQYLISGAIGTSGYMTSAMAKSFLSTGSEISSHTVSHPDLTTLTASQLDNELHNSQTTLQALFGLGVAQNFASPYGTYDAASIAGIQKYYRSHRSTGVGYNSKDTFNPYDIVVQNIETTTTPAEVASWVARAKADKTWLVLVYHKVSNSTSLDDYAVTPAHLGEELSNIQGSGISVKTINQALDIIQAQL